MSKSKLAQAFNQNIETKAQREEAPTQQAKAGTQTSRVKKKSINAFVDPAVVKQMKMLSVETDKTQQSLFIEALNLLFEKYHKKGIA